MAISDEGGLSHGDIGNPSAITASVVAGGYYAGAIGQAMAGVGDLDHGEVVDMVISLAIRNVVMAKTLDLSPRTRIGMAVNEADAHQAEIEAEEDAATFGAKTAEEQTASAIPSAIAATVAAAIAGAVNMGYSVDASTTAAIAAAVAQGQSISAYSGTLGATFGQNGPLGTTQGNIFAGRGGNEGGVGPGATPGAPPSGDNPTGGGQQSP